MSSVVDLLGPAVLDQARQRVATSVFIQSETVVGLYFSAFYPHGRTFTALLVNFYNRMRSRGQGAAARFEVVFIGSDASEEAFNNCFVEMPWYALPFTEESVKLKLLRRYHIESLPALVLVDGPTGQLITVSGRDCLAEDLEGTDFPWPLKALTDVLEGELLRGSERLCSAAVLDGCVKGFYFSAHWCPPCRSFTPTLMSVYKKVRAAGKKFEIVFVSSDRSLSSFNDYFKTMPWVALPYQDTRIRVLTRHFAVEGIPTLVLVDDKNELITTNCRTAIMVDPEGKNFPWNPQSVEALTEENSSALSESACLILFTDGNPEIISKASELLTDTALQYNTLQKATIYSEQELPQLRFFYEGIESEEVADSIRSLTQLEGRQPVIAIVDTVSGRTYSAPEGDISKESLEKLIDDFKLFSVAADEVLPSA